MCGIAGVYQRDGHAADPFVVEGMLKPMVHRGPDDSGQWNDAELALGHLRLAILDPSERAHQPMTTPDGRGVLVYNGEVYNAPALRAELEAQGIRFRSHGDTEVVLHALHAWGAEAAIRRFDGMFAFAYFDSRPGTLWLGRDRLGIKPLYVARTPGALVFASELKGLLAHPRVDARPDHLGLTRHMLRGRIVGRRTAFEGLEAVEPGTLWEVNGPDVEVRRWYSVLRALDVERLERARHERPAAAVEEFDALIARSVRMHGVSDVPIAAACSGGVDSSLIAALTQRDRPDLTGYVAAMDGAGADAEFAGRVGRHLGLPVQRVRLDRATHLRLLPTAVWHNESPLFFPSSTALLALARHCHAEGIEVLLTGEGADELFGGYHWHAKVHRAWRRWPWSRRMPPDEPPRAMAPDAAGWLERRIATLDPAAELEGAALFERLSSVTPIADRAFLAQCLEDLHGHLGGILQHHDRMGMAASIEMRVPFLQNDLIDFALHLPRRVKLHRGVGKWVVKKAAERYLPRDVLYVPKRGFPMPPDAFPLAENLLRGGVVTEIFDWSPLDTERMFRAARGQAWLSIHLTTLELWGRLFLRGEGIEELAERLGAPPTRR